MNLRFYTLFAFLLVFCSGLTAQERTITDADLMGGQTYTWSADTTYILDGYVYLEDGGTLTIEPGTVIKGLQQASNGIDGTSALIITRGAQIFAEGTATNPIIFTSSFDDIADPNDMDILLDRGSWGGLIVLGNGIVGEDGGVENVEGIPSEETRAQYGGNDNTDNSGILRFVSIRYGGEVLSNDNEINGLTLGGVGSGTTIEYVEIFGNSDDGIELFGGAVDIKYAVAAFCGDESFDWDESWAGRGQFWFGIQLPMDPSGNEQFGGEHDGSEAADLSPQVTNTVYNATYIGMGVGNGNGNDNTALQIRRDVAATYVNSIFTGFATAGLKIRDTSVDRYLADDFELSNNIWFDFGVGSTLADIIDADAQEAAVITKLTDQGNEITDPMLAGISRTSDGELDPRPNAGSPALEGAKVASDPWFDRTTFRGAFSNFGNWAQGWTNLDALGYFGDKVQRVEKYIVDADLVGGETYNWSADTTYVLDGYVYLEEGGVLNIEAGTIIKGLQQASNGIDGTSALIITRGAQIFAEGTATDPIIFTSNFDDVNDNTDMDLLLDRGLWGGLIVLGNGIVGEDGGEENVEGIPSEETRARYGGDDNADNSGVIRFVSIRYGGEVLSNDNEINGLTLGGVGSGTTIEYVEIFGNSDDGIELFGGAVDIKYAVAAFCGDESFDWDESWAGRGQFWFGIQLPNDPSGNEQFGGEHDGSEAADLSPQVTNTVYNATYIGMGVGNGNGNDNTALQIRRDVAATYVNSIFTGFATAALKIRDSSVDRYLADDFELSNNIWFDFGAGNTLADIVDADAQEAAVIAKLADQGNEIADPMLAGISRAANGNLDPRPNAGSPAYNNVAMPADEWFTRTSFRGAFGNGNNWAMGWTNMDALGYFGDLVTSGSRFVVDSDLVAGQTYNWTSDSTYILDGYVYLEEGGVLNIAPGTVVKGLQQATNGIDGTSALIITRGAQINANGTKEEPIIFTAEVDDVDDPTDMDLLLDRGLWGGLIILGNGIVGEDTGVENVEGIPSEETRAEYGGTDNTDNSGTLRYVSIRYGGEVLSNDNEINGLTLGGVGSGTTIEYVEIFGNSDDGIELFGGAVDIKYAIAAFCGDESFDWDESWAGRGQFWFGIQLPMDPSGNEQFGGEHDGSEAADLSPQVTNTVYNATYIGMGVGNGNGNDNTALRIRRDVAATYVNSIFTGFATAALKIQDTSIDRYLADDFELSNNIWFDFGAGTTLEELVEADAMQAEIITKLIAQGNELVDPMLGNISRAPEGALDPRPDADSPAFTNVATPSDEWFDAVDFRGAFNNSDNWALDWTNLDYLGYFGDLVVLGTYDFAQNEEGLKLMTPQPNPAINQTRIVLEMPQGSEAQLSVFDMSGRPVMNLDLGYLSTGENTYELNTSKLTAGQYIMALRTEFGAVTQFLSVVK